MSRSPGFLRVIHAPPICRAAELSALLLAAQRLPGSQAWTASWDSSNRFGDLGEERGKSTVRKRITKRAMRMSITTLLSIFEVSASLHPRLLVFTCQG